MTATVERPTSLINTADCPPWCENTTKTHQIVWDGQREVRAHYRTVLTYVNNGIVVTVQLIKTDSDDLSTPPGPRDDMKTTVHYEGRQVEIPYPDTETLERALGDLDLVAHWGYEDITEDGDAK